MSFLPQKQTSNGVVNDLEKKKKVSRNCKYEQTDSVNSSQVSFFVGISVYIKFQNNNFLFMAMVWYEELKEYFSLQRAENQKAF